jgi:hypothetical protein
MNAHPNTLRAALTARYLSDPKLAHEAVTGICEWRHDVSADYLDDLRYQADDMAWDLEQARLSDDLTPVERRSVATRHRIDTLRAAEDALKILAERVRYDERMREWAAEEARFSPTAPYLQGEFI